MPLPVRLALGFALGTALLIGVVELGFVLQLRTSLDTTLDVGLAGERPTVVPPPDWAAIDPCCSRITRQ